MAASFTAKRAKLIEYIATETDATTTEAQDISGATANLGIMIVEVDNTLNTTEVVHAALYNSGADIDVGTTVPDLLFRVQGGVARQFIGISDEGSPSTTTFANLAIAGVVDAGSIGGSPTSPTSDVIVRVGIKDMA